MSKLYFIVAANTRARIIRRESPMGFAMEQTAAMPEQTANTPARGLQERDVSGGTRRNQAGYRREADTRSSCCEALMTSADHSGVRPARILSAPLPFISVSSVA